MLALSLSLSLETLTCLWEAIIDRQGDETGQMIINCPCLSVSPGDGLMKLYITRWLQDRRKRLLELGFNQFADKRGLN